MTEKDNKVELITSKDGSHTLYVKSLNEHYHSVNGAIQESMHVFIQAGLQHIKGDSIKILEFGFGTGLNVLLTYINSNDKSIYYHSLEKYPVEFSVIKKLNYTEFRYQEFKDIYLKLHDIEWDKEVELNKEFVVKKELCDFKSKEIQSLYNLIYFDAFAPEVQPDLWSIEMFQKAYDVLLPNGVLVTYCAKGAVRRTMQDVGFKVERLPGPPGKREMLRATKI